VLFKLETIFYKNKFSENVNIRETHTRDTATCFLAFVLCVSSLALAKVLR